MPYWIPVAVTVCSITIVCLILIFKTLIERKQIDHICQRYVFITGCDSGFGYLLARTLDSKGVPVFAGCLTTNAAEELSKETSSRLRTVIIDVTDGTSISNAVNLVQSKLPKNAGLWGLVNNAGVMPSYAPFEMTTVEEFDVVCRVNLFGPMRVTKAFLPLVRRTGGRVVNVCSVVANFALPGVANYCTSKAALKAFTDCLREEVRGSGVTVHSIEPGGFTTAITDTDRLKNGYRRAYERSSEDVKEFYGGHMASNTWRGFKMNAAFLSSKRHWVSDAMGHALLARYPKKTYLVGFDAKMFFKPLTYLPTFIGDLLVSWPKPYGKRELELKDWPMT